MKAVIFLSFVLAVVAADSTFRLPQNEVEKLRRVHDDCQADTKTKHDEHILRHLYDHMDDKQVAVHMLCMAVNAGLMDRDGTLHRDTIRAKITLGARPDANIDELLTKCVKSLSTPEETALKMWACFGKNDIHYYHRI